jgi:predicted nucleic acid-binding Zn ribbon protein
VSADVTAGGGQPDGDGPVTAGAAPTGPQLARAVLDAARSRRMAAPGARRATGTTTGSGRRLRGYSGPGPDPRDPQLFGAVLVRLVKARGWQRPAAEATVFGDWPNVVGPDIAEHCRPVKLENGELTIEAESTAWATQLRLLSAKVLAGIAAKAGHNVVTRLHIHGPAAPSWTRGPRRVRGRGPRDTYG